MTSRTALLAAVLVGVGLAALPAAVALAKPAAGTYRIVLSSNRDGQARGYTVLPDGSGLTPLLPAASRLVPVAVSDDGGTIAYTDGSPVLTGRSRPPEAIYASRADGSGLRRVADIHGYSPTFALSHDGGVLAWSRLIGSSCCASAIWTVGIDGRGPKRLTSGPEDGLPDWSPDGKTLAFNDRAVVLQPLHGALRVLVRGRSASRIGWSPDGHWIAWTDFQGLWVIRPDGTRRHRLAPAAATATAHAFAWSPEGRRIVFANTSGAVVVGVDGRGRRRLALDGLTVSELGWAPDGNDLILAAHAGADPDQVWIAHADGSGLRRLTAAGTNTVLGFTRLAPVLPSAPPLPDAARVLGVAAVATAARVKALSADGSRVAFVTEASASDCDHVSVWTPVRSAVFRFGLPAPCREAGVASYAIFDVELAGTRVAWTELAGCGNSCQVELRTATLAHPVPALGGYQVDGYETSAGHPADVHLHGSGDLLVFGRDVPPSAGRPDELSRVGPPARKCGARAGACVTTLRSGEHACCAVSVSAGRIALREQDTVAVLGARGTLLRLFPFPPEDVKAARLDGGTLVAERLAYLETYDVATGKRRLSRPLPSGYRLTDAEGGIAVLRSGDAILLLRLVDGRSFKLAPGRGPVLADLEPPGLYYSYATADGGGRVVFVPRDQLLHKLGGGS